MRHIVNGISRRFYEKSLGLLLIRVVIGIVFFMHGFSKVTNLGMITGFFAHMGLPAWVAFFIAWLEVIGGIALILGIATRVFACAFGIEMLVAIFLGGGIAKGWQPHELEAVLMAVSFGLVYTGSGRFSLFRVECQHCGAFACRIEDCPARA